MYAQLHQFLNHAGVALLEQFEGLSSLTLKFVPQVGVVMCVDKEATAAGSPAAMRLSIECRKQYETEDSVFYKSEATDQLDDKFGDLTGAIDDREKHLIRELEWHLLHRAGALTRLVEQLAQLDCLISFAIVANDRSFVRPVLRDDNEIVAVVSVPAQLRSNEPSDNAGFNMPEL